MSKIKIKVRPNSKDQSVEDKKDFYLVNLKSRAESNKANVELLGLLKKYFKKSVKIKSGFASRNKIIEIDIK